MWFGCVGSFRFCFVLISPFFLHISVLTYFSLFLFTLLFFTFTFGSLTLRFAEFASVFSKIRDLEIENFELENNDLCLKFVF